MRAAGDAMAGAGVGSGDVLLVDRAAVEGTVRIFSGSFWPGDI